MAVKGGLKFLRRRIRAVRNIQKVTKAMKTISSARLKRAQPIFLNSKNYVELLGKIFKVFVPSQSQPQEILGDGMRTSEFYLWTGGGDIVRSSEGLSFDGTSEMGDGTLFIVLGSDRGLCGAFNTNILKTAYENIEKLSGRSKRKIIWVFGRRVSRQITKRYKGDFEVREFNDFWRNFSLKTFSDIFDDIKKLIQNQEVSEIYCIYTFFKSVGTQYPVCEKIFPFYLVEVWEEKKIFEPGKEEVIKFFSILWLKSKLFSCFQSSITSEHAARMRAMDMATQNAERFAKQLTLQMNKARQEAITKELIDIINGKNALEAEAV